MCSKSLFKSVYKPEYCDMLIKHSEEGKNLREFAAKINVNMSTLTRWAKKFPEFQRAKETADLKYRSYWEELRRNHMQRRFCYTEFLFVMVNNFGYKNPKRE